MSLVSATSAQGVDFDWLDKRSMDPVGYKRINKTTGKEVTKENIVKGVAFEKGRYVVLSEEEIRSAHPKSTQTIEIIAFVASDQIPLPNIDTPYFLAPDKRGGKVYALLRETLKKTRKVALANVVPAHQTALGGRDAPGVRHGAGDAALARRSAQPGPTGNWAATSPSRPGQRRTRHGQAPGGRHERRLAARRIPRHLPGKIMALVARKAKAGKIEDVESQEAGEERKSADVVGLTELLKRSLAGKPAAKKRPRKSPPRRPPEPAVRWRKPWQSL